MSSNKSIICFDADEKSIKMYDSYSAFANASTVVDFPTRLAPSTKTAVLPLLFRFQSSNWSYSFLLNIKISLIQVTFRNPHFLFLHFTRNPQFLKPRFTRNPLFLTCWKKVIGVLYRIFAKKSPDNGRDFNLLFAK